MILRVNPNRMELLRLRRRLVLARRGHKLLEDKLEEMMRRFLELLKDIDKAKADFQSRTAIILRDLLYCRITSSADNFKESLTKIYPKISLAISTTRIMNVKVPLFHLEEFQIEKQYDFFKTSAQMDLVVAQAKDYLISLLKLAQTLKTLDILSFEIERTRRRVNALEYMFIPSLQDTIRYITQKLNELERANLVRLMRVKEIVRAH
jgi:V/A-type H+-transporting ATPase subunit D